MKSYTSLISQELALFNFEPLDILCARIGHPCEKLWLFEFPESFQCLISSVSIYYKLESDIRVKSYEHLNYSRASIVQFRASRYIISLNRTFVWKVMTIWISQELPLFNFEPLDILCAWIGYPCEKLWPFEYLDSFWCLIRAYQYIISLNRTSVWKVMTILISRELPFFIFERLYMWCSLI